MFQPENEAAVAFYVLEQTMIGGNNYILVTDSEEGEDGEALILVEKNLIKNNSMEKKAADKADTAADKTGAVSEAIYEIVTDQVELDAVAAVFSSLLEDTTLS